MTYYGPKRPMMRQPPKVIRRDELLQLIEDKGGSEGLDLREVLLVGDGPSIYPWQNPIDLSPEALKRQYAIRYGGRGRAPWLNEHGNMCLRRVQLQEASLNGANLEHAELIEAQLELAYIANGVNLQHALLQRAELRDACLSESDLRWAQLSWANVQHADLAGAQLQGASLYEAHLEDATLNRARLEGASLYGAQLEGTILSGAHLHDANLQRANLQGAHVSGAQLCHADLRYAHLERLDMYDVGTLDGARWYGALLDHTRIKGESLGKAVGEELDAREAKTAEAYDHAKEAYLLLKNNFNQIGRYEDASWAYVKEQQMEKMAYCWEWRVHGLRFWRAWGAFWRWLRNWAYELATGYGERPWLPALWAIAVVAAFVGIYAGAGNISPDFAGDPAQAHGSHSLLDALTHSIGAFATIGFNTLEPLGWGARLLTAVESALGIGLFALFIFTLGNRMSRG